MFVRVIVHPLSFDLKIPIKNVVNESPLQFLNTCFAGILTRLDKEIRKQYDALSIEEKKEFIRG